MNEKKMVLFDYDGVLVDSMSRNLIAGTQAAVRIGHNIMPVKGDVHRMREVSFEELGRIVKIPEGLLGQYSDICFQILDEIEDPVEFFPDVEHVLTSLHGKVEMGIVTGNMADEVNTQLAYAGLQDLFGPVLGMETPGSKGEKILKLMADEGVSAFNTYMVGDSAGDIREANIANVTSVAATWGYQPRDFLEAENPDVIIDSITEVLPLVL